MPWIRRNGSNWAITGHWGVIELSDAEARTLARRILSEADTQEAGENAAKTETRTQRVVRLVMTDIRSGEFKEGQRLDEVSLADRYCVSRTPIREALMQLAVSGAVTREANKGCRVATSIPRKLNQE